MKTKFVLTIVVLMAALPLLASERIDESYPASATGDVLISNISGSVKVTGWDRNEVEIAGTLGDGTERLEVDRDDDRIRIVVRVPRRSHNVEESHLTISVPRRSSLEVETVSARSGVSGVEGELDFTSVSGNVSISGRPSALSVSSVSGRVKVEFAPEDSEISAVSGSIEVFDCSGALEVASISGDIVVHSGELDSLDAATTSGSVHCEAKPSGRGSFEFDTMSGNVVLVVPRSISADFELSTFSGHIKNQIGPKPTRTSKYAPGEKAEFSTGSGGAQISMSSFSGSVKLLVQ
ncbi:MAG: DUF4097 domain-containing protein [bacterium]|nr:DUF4097 domain-containing protein [bacterium]